MFQFLDHPSETLIQIEAKTAKEVFCDAATALFEIMTDTRTVKSDKQFEFRLDSSELPLLLIDWLNRLILLHEVENVFLSLFEVCLEHNDSWKLKATATGETIQDRHERRSHAKSATYGQLEWKEHESGHTVRFVVDV